MKQVSATLLALASVALASPSAWPQQGFDFAAVDAAPKVNVVGPVVGVSSDPVTYSPQAAYDAALASSPSKHKRDAILRRTSTACAAQPVGSAPGTSPDTYSDFMANPQYGQIANAAEIPDGYSVAFTNLNGATQSPTYLGFYTLAAYDPIKCQEYCDEASSCYSFNVFMERDPSVTPGDGCANPASTVNYKCSLFGAQIDSSSATNTGQWQDQFQVGIVGSNGYNKLAPPPAQANFDGPTEMGCAITAPSGYIGMRFFSGPYDPSQCAAVCQQTTQFDHDHLVRSDGTYDACNFFNSYVLSNDSAPQGTYCAMYTTPWDKSYSMSNCGQHRGSDYWSVSQSYGYSLDPQDPGTVNTASSTPNPSSSKPAKRCQSCAEKKRKRAAKAAAEARALEAKK